MKSGGTRDVRSCSPPGVGTHPGPTLGPFLPLERIGKGAMGVVWRAVHCATGQPVAIKVLTAAIAQDPSFASSLRNEVEAVARLHHPGIVRVYDFGIVPTSVPPGTASELPPGCPYLVMQLARGGPFADRRPVGDWATLQWVLLSLCDALAHAHARGVIHRDLKPANVLVDERPGDGPGLMLTDFGVAHARHDDPSSVTLGSFAACGTPRYMAPEQFAAAWRDHGPWTDL